ncbi:TonB-dependent receptor [Massilia sp. CCM 9210]|uniref:TonB-dependent receptor plug domain-containing protein n=1 Tax=Massilia scottii TaxID=3057166 RepID=UPI0027965E0F|nr:TonB-dependent receptor [Massilia sp. CCM 9210]MDQ1814182.1 TonB-dependent receptor [Massilia sp. CCM 9210]
MVNRIANARLVALSIALAWPGAAMAQSTDEEELALTYGERAVVSIATGTRQPLARAPAVASVISAADIAAMGASDLDQVLESVPGLHVSSFSAPFNPIYSIRGIHTGYNPQVLMLVNGLPITSVFAGNRGQAWGGMPLENVARIEVIRGPGSALYGADAFSGVINVVTKTAADLRGVESGVRLGSFNSRDAWVQSGHAWGPLRAALYLRAGGTDGAKRVVEQDVQSGLDALFGTRASRAPGTVSASRRAFDARTDLEWGNWRLRGAYQKRETGIGVGLADALDPDARVPETRTYLDLSYSKAGFVQHWDLSAVLGYHALNNRPGDPAYRLFPAGAFGGAWPDGVVGNPGHAERHYNASVSAFYTGFDAHRIRVGAGYRVDDLHSATETKNFSFALVPGVGATLTPLPALVDATGNPALAYLTPHKRDIQYAFVQDEWRIANDWTLTAGVRHDRYSDFGGTTNPRAALVWDAAYNVIVKAIYGRAFRAPHFVEQYTINNPVNVGNPNLNPETIETGELAVSWQPAGDWRTSLNLFRYRMRDIIVAAPNADPGTGKTFRNTGDQSGRGVEFEAAWTPVRALRLAASMSYQRSIDEASGRDAGLAPHRRLFARADWRAAPAWRIGATVNHVADRRREPGDTRAPIADYTTTDMSVLRERLFGNWELRASVLNLFDRDVREPSVAPGNIPFDLPMPGRALSLQIRHAM